MLFLRFCKNSHTSFIFRRILNRLDATCFADMEGSNQRFVCDGSILEEIQGWVWRVSYAHDFRRIIINNLNK